MADQVVVEEDEDNDEAIAALALLAGTGLNSLSEYFTKDGVRKFLPTVRVSGLTIKEHMRINRINTMNAFNSLFTTVVMNETPLEDALDQLDKVVARRKRNAVTTIKNVMTGVRGRARSIAAVGQDVTWVNNGVLDTGTTDICRGYMTSTWDLPYSQIPDKPPRVAVTPHPCRSFLTSRKREGPKPAPEPSFMDQFDSSEKLQKFLLPEAQYNAFKSGDLAINSYGIYEKLVLRTVSQALTVIKKITPN